MSCIYCGKENQLVMDNILSGAVCNHCYTYVRGILDSTKNEVSIFYKRLQDLGLWNAFVEFLDMFKRDNKQIHFIGLKEDKRRKCPYVLAYRVLSGKKVPMLVEISIAEYRNKSMIKIKYNNVSTSTELYVDKDCKYFAGETKDSSVDFNWVKEEFNL